MPHIDNFKEENTHALTKTVYRDCQLLARPSSIIRVAFSVALPSMVA